MTSETNPDLSTPDRSLESIRLAHLRQESAIKSVGQLCYLVGFFSILGTFEFALFAARVIPRDEFKALLPGSLLDLLFGTFTLVFAINTLAQFALGYGLIRLQPWSRWTVIVLTGISLILGTVSSLVVCVSGATSGILEPLVGFAVNDRILGLTSLVVGGAFHLLILGPLVGPGSSLVFSARYREVIRLTPSIKSRMHWLLKVLVGSLMMMVLGFIAYLVAIYYRVID